MHFVYRVHYRPLTVCCCDRHFCLFTITMAVQLQEICQLFYFLSLGLVRIVMALQQYLKATQRPYT